MYAMGVTIYRVKYSIDRGGEAKAVFPDRYELSSALDCARSLAKEGRYTKVVRESDGKEVWNSVDG